MLSATRGVVAGAIGVGTAAEAGASTVPRIGAVPNAKFRSSSKAGAGPPFNLAGLANGSDCEDMGVASWSVDNVPKYCGLGATGVARGDGELACGGLANTAEGLLAAGAGGGCEVRPAAGAPPHPSNHLSATAAAAAAVRPAM